MSSVLAGAGGVTDDEAILNMMDQKILAFKDAELGVLTTQAGQFRNEINALTQLVSDLKTKVEKDIKLQLNGVVANVKTSGTLNGSYGSSNYQSSVITGNGYAIVSSSCYEHPSVGGVSYSQSLYDGFLNCKINGGSAISAAGFITNRGSVITDRSYSNIPSYSITVNFKIPFSTSIQLIATGGGYNSSSTVTYTIYTYDI